jgi:hypothetical protein
MSGYEAGARGAALIARELVASDAAREERVA